MPMIVLPDNCQNCGEKVVLDELILGRRHIHGCVQLFWICSHCNEEIEMAIRMVDADGT